MKNSKDVLCLEDKVAGIIEPKCHSAAPLVRSEKIWPVLNSSTNKRPMVDLLPDVTCFGLEEISG